MSAYNRDDFNDAVVDFFYDDYFKGEEGHNYTDEQVALSVEQADIDNCLEIMRSVLYKHFNIQERRKK